MQLIEYLNKLTEDGMAVILPTEKHRQEKISTGRDEFGNGFEVVCYTSESLGQAKQDEKLLKTITSAVLNCKDCESWWAYCRKACSRQYESGAVDEAVRELYDTLLTTLSIRLSEMLIVERWSTSAKTLLSILNARIKTWQKEAKVEATEGGKSVVISFEGI